MANVFDEVLPPQGNQVQAQTQQQGQQPATNQPVPNSPGGNIFDSVLPPAQGQQQQPAAKIATDTAYNQRLNKINEDGKAIGSSTMDFVDAFNNQISKLPNGIMQLLGLGDLKAEGGVSPNEQQAINQANSDAAIKNSPIAGRLGAVAGFAGNAINSTALMAPAAAGLSKVGAAASSIAPEASTALQQAAGTLLPKVLQGSAEGAGFMGMQAVDPNDPNARRNNILAGGIIGALTPVASIVGEWGADRAKAFGGYLNKVINPEGAALNAIKGKLSSAVDDLHPNGITGQDIQAGVDAAKSSGNSLSLGEITNNDAIKSMESKLGTGADSDVAEVTAHLNNLKNNLGEAIPNTINSIVPEGSPADVENMLGQQYENFKNYAVPDDQMKQLLDNSTLKEYLQDAANNPVTPQSLQELPINNVAKLANTNVDLNKALYKNTSLLTKDNARPLTPSERTALIEAKSQLQTTLNNVVPDNGYANTMDLAQRQIQRNGMLNDIDNIKGGAGSVDLNGKMQPPIKQVANALWGTQPQIDNFLNMVQNSGGDVLAAKNLIYTVNHAVDSPITTILKGTRVATDTTAQKIESEGIVKEAINELTTNDYKKALLNLTLGGGDNHATLINAMNTPSLGQRIVNLNNALKATKVGNAISTAIQQSGIPSKAVMQSNYGQEAGHLAKGYLPTWLGGTPKASEAGGQ